MLLTKIRLMANSIINIEPLGFPWKTQDPFLFCVHHRDEFPSGNGQMQVKPEYLNGRNIGNDFTIKDGWRMYHGQQIPGFPYHPHRGFETITINKEGVVDHTDSLGAAGRFMAGDVQWMTAGKGVQHSEMFPLVNSDKHNHMEIFQIWLNLPKASKFVEPHFKMLWREDIPVALHTDDHGRKTIIDVIAGDIKDTTALNPTPDSWAANADNAVGVYTIKMDAQAEWELPATDSGANRTIYFYRGSSLSVDNQEITAHRLIEVHPDADIKLVSGTEETYLLVLEGKPIGEPVVQYGPFVMNTQAEIQEAMMDYQRTQFGGWPWPEREQVHPADKGRFALHADGHEEIK